MHPTWLVVLEAPNFTDAGSMDVATLRRVLERASHASPAGLHSADRYALQLSVSSPTPVGALEAALDIWHDALAAVGLNHQSLLRTEVITAEEFSRECSGEGSGLGMSGCCDGASPVTPAENVIRDVFRDEATGLDGPEIFWDDLSRALGTCGSTGSPAVLVAEVACIGGAHHNDAFLVAVTERVRHTIRPTDTWARLGQDRLALLLPSSTYSAAVSVARRVLDEVRKPLILPGQVLFGTATMGVAMGSGGAQAQALVDDALAALSAARRSGKPYAVFGDMSAAVAGLRSFPQSLQFQCDACVAVEHENRPSAPATVANDAESISG